MNWTHPQHATTTTKPQAGALHPHAKAGEAFCHLSVSLFAEPSNPLKCTGFNCTFEEGKPSFSCAASACSCPAKGKCIPLVEDIIAKVRARFVVLLHVCLLLSTVRVALQLPNQFK